MQHSFDIEIAKEFGITEAVLLNHLYFWITKNKANDNNFYDGKYWTYNSRKAFSELFPYFSEGKIYRALRSLEEKGLILTGNYNKLSFDRTKWYALSDMGNEIVQNKQCNCTKMNNVIVQNEQTIPDSKPDINTDSKPDIKKKHKYGEYKHVLLTDNEYEKLIKKYGEKQAIENIKLFDEALELKGYKYKSHYLAILKWYEVPKKDEWSEVLDGLA